MDDKKKTVDVVIPTYQPGAGVVELVGWLERQTHPADHIIIMNTEQELWEKSGIEATLTRNQLMEKIRLFHVTKQEFDHGKTRDLGIRHSQADVVICMTQDAMPCDEYLVEELLKGLEKPGVVQAYARQLPAKDCGVIEAWTRGFNYPETSRVKTKQDLPELGIKTYFASNVCAAYDRAYYLHAGGFLPKTIFNEDMIFAAGVIEDGKAIAYCADARVIHSHNYSCMEQFHRNFDLEVSQADHPEIFSRVKSESEGIRMVKRNAAYLWSVKKPWLIPRLVMVSGFKFIGYRMGKQYRKLPRRVVLACTMNKNYWRS